jgi:hypothetical protein
MKTTIGGAIQRSNEPERPRKKVKIPNANASPGRRGKRVLIAYVDLEVHAAFKVIAEDQDCTMEDLVKEGINYILQRHGRKPIA